MVIAPWPGVCCSKFAQFCYQFAIYATKGANMCAVDITDANLHALLICVSWIPKKLVQVSDSSPMRESHIKAILGKPANVYEGLT